MGSVLGDEAVFDEGDVVGHGAVQQHGFLQHESDLGTQTVQGEVADVDTLDADAPGVGISESRDHAQHVDLPPPVGPTMPTMSPGWTSKVMSCSTGTSGW